MTPEKVKIIIEKISDDITTLGAALMGIFGTFTVFAPAAGVLQNILSITAIATGVATSIASVVFNILAEKTPENVVKGITDIITYALPLAVAIFAALNLSGAITVAENVQASVVAVSGYVAVIAGYIYDGATGRYSVEK